MNTFVLDIWGKRQAGSGDGGQGRAPTEPTQSGGWPCGLKQRCVTMPRRRPARCVAPRSTGLGVSAFARQLTVRQPGGGDIQLRFCRYPRTHRDRRPFINASSATAGTSGTSIAANADSSVDASARAGSAQPVMSPWPSAICYLNTPNLPTTHGRKGAEPPLSRTLSPQVPSAPRILKTGGDPSHTRTPLLGHSSGRHRAGLSAAPGLIS